MWRKKSDAVAVVLTASIRLVAYLLIFIITFGERFWLAGAGVMMKDTAPISGESPRSALTATRSVYYLKRGSVFQRILDFQGSLLQIQS